VPLLWLGGALTKKDTIITGTVNQLDIARTILNQMGLDASPFIFSRDLFGVGRNNWAFFTYNDGIGLITDSSRMIYDNAGQRVVYEQGKVGAEQSEVAKALMWKVYNDFLKR
jgi:hypothetical protein